MIVHLTQNLFLASVSIKQLISNTGHVRIFYVLEIGCGTGIDLRLFPETFEVHGVDLNDTALNIAKEKLAKFDFKKSSITDLPFDDSSIDFIFTHQLLNYLEDDILEKGIS